MDEAYKVTLKVEEKVDTKIQQKLRGKGPRGRGRTSISKVIKKEEESTSVPSNRGNGTRRCRAFERGKGKHVITCYKCGVEGLSHLNS